MLNGLYRCHIAAYALGIGQQLHVIVEIEVAEHTVCTGLIQGAAKIEHHLPAFVEFLVVAQTVAYVEALHIVFNSITESVRCTRYSSTRSYCSIMRAYSSCVSCSPPDSLSQRR